MIILEETGMQDAQILMDYMLDARWKSDALMAGGRYLRNQLRHYPPPKPRPNPALTRKQRIYLAIAVREGRITIPYRRTYGMREAWQLTREPGAAILIHNPTNAARWTMGVRRSRFHQEGGWRNMEESWKRYQRGTVEAVEAEISQLFRARNRTWNRL